MRFNINENVKCVLTTYGEEILKSKGSIYYMYNYNQAKCELSVQLWVLMNIFGDEMVNGGRQIIVDNVLEL